MEIMVALNGQKRKVLAKIIGDVLSSRPLYKGPPTYAYEIGPVTLDRNGAILFMPDETLDLLTIKHLLDTLTNAGFTPQLSTIPDELQENALQDTISQEIEPAPKTEVTQGHTIQIPRSEFNESSLENLRLLIQSKSTLIKKALGVNDLPIVTVGKTVDFPWFQEDLPQPELKAYTDLVTAMCNMAKRQQRIFGVEKPTDNDKFTFRLFLVRLGLKGEEYAATRHILLRNLSGNGSWKDGAVKKPTEPPAPPAALPPATPPIEEHPDNNGLPTKHRFSWHNWFKKIRMMGY